MAKGCRFRQTVLCVQLTVVNNCLSNVHIGTEKFDSIFENLNHLEAMYERDERCMLDELGTHGARRSSPALSPVPLDA